MTREEQAEDTRELLLSALCTIEYTARRIRKLNQTTLELDYVAHKIRRELNLLPEQQAASDNSKAANFGVPNAH